MHKIYHRIISTGLICSLLFIASMFSACTNDDKDVSVVKLEVFGPSPALRGGTIKFIGVNMDKVSSIVLPNNVVVTDITKSGTNEISITVPQETSKGYIVLKTPSGDIKTLTPLTFTEPISIDSYTSTPVKAGDLFTITGDYLNLVAKVVFANEAVVDSSVFKSQTRKKIELFVPRDAKSGKLYIATGDQIPIVVYSSGSATVTDPTTLATIAPSIVKAKSNLVITGTYLNLVKSVIFPDGLKIDSAVIAFNSAKTQMTVQVPEKAKEGTIKVVTYSGTEMLVPQGLKLVAPAVTSLVSANVKNGEPLQITGTDLDLVTSVTFAGSVDGVITAQTETSLTVAVPLTATDGAATLNTNSGLTASTAALTMIRPSFTSISPLALTAGDNVTIVGTDLDLVRKVSFVGGSVAVTPATGTTLLTITVPTTCAGTGSVTFETVNGTKVTSTDQLAIKASTTPAITSITQNVAPGGLMIITGKNLNYVESIVFEDNVKAVLYGTRTETEIRVFIPLAAKHGQTTFTMTSFDSEKIVSPTFIYGTDPVQDVNYVYFDFDSKGSWWGDKGSVENDASASLDGSKYFHVNADMNPWWTGFFWRNGKNGLNTTGVTVANWVVKLDVNPVSDIAGDMKLRLKGSDGDFWALIPGMKSQGGWYTITVPLTSFVTTEGVQIPNMDNLDSDFGMAYTASTAEHINLYIDNIRFEKISGSSSVNKYSLY